VLIVEVGYFSKKKLVQKLARGKSITTIIYFSWYPILL